MNLNGAWARRRNGNLCLAAGDIMPCTQRGMETSDLHCEVFRQPSTNVPAWPKADYEESRGGLVG